jgi:serine/threonine protein kinase
MLLMLTSMGERRTLGRFVCGEEIASGPLGVLHRARVYGDAGFEKDFALLVVDDELASDREAMGRLVRAANGWARLSHPRIARAHELAAQGDIHYLVSDWIRGAPLSAIVEDGPLATDAALLVAIEVADAVANAHGRTDLLPGGILHLGLAPDSILVDGDGRVFVRDFGLLSMRVEPGWADDDRLVDALRYAAPELQMGRGNIDGRADVFGLAAVLFELLAGRPAFVGTRAVDIAAQSDASPPSLSGIPAAAGPLLARALAARAAARLPSLADFRTQAMTLLGDRVATARAMLAERARDKLPADVTRRSPLEGISDPPPTAIRAPSVADDFFAAMPEVAGEAQPLPPPPSMLPSAANVATPWGGRPLLPPPSTTVWDPPSTTATTTLDALRRQRPKLWKRMLPPAALVAMALAVATVAFKIERGRTQQPSQPSAAPTQPTTAQPTTAQPTATQPTTAQPTAPAATTPATLPRATIVRSQPTGAKLFVDGKTAGTTPATLSLSPGPHALVLVAEGQRLWRGPLEAGVTIEAPLAPATLPPAIDGEAGLKLVCKRPGQYRIFVDGADSGRACPAEERISMKPGLHHVTLYAAEGDRTVEIERPVTVHDRGSSTRVILDE